MIGVEDRLPHTLIHSLTLSHTLPLNSYTITIPTTLHPSILCIAPIIRCKSSFDDAFTLRIDIREDDLTVNLELIIIVIIFNCY